MPQAAGKVLLAKQFLHFHGIGALGAGVNLATLYVAFDLLGAWLYGALCVSFTAAVLFNFTLIKHWTFKDKSWQPRLVLRQFLLFYSFAVTGLLLNLVVFALLHNVGDISVYTAQFLAICLVAPLHFVVNKLFTFPAPTHELIEDDELHVTDRAA